VTCRTPTCIARHRFFPPTNLSWARGAFPTEHLIFDILRGQPANRPTPPPRLLVIQSAASDLLCVRVKRALKSQKRRLELQKLALFSTSCAVFSPNLYFFTACFAHHRPSRPQGSRLSPTP